MKLELSNINIRRSVLHNVIQRMGLYLPYMQIFALYLTGNICMQVTHKLDIFSFVDKGEEEERGNFNLQLYHSFFLFKYSFFLSKYSIGLFKYSFFLFKYSFFLPTMQGHLKINIDLLSALCPPQLYKIHIFGTRRAGIYNVFSSINIIGTYIKKAN